MAKKAAKKRPKPERPVGNDLTTRQQEVLDVINAYWRDNHRSPTVRDIGASLDITSPNGVMCHLRALEKKGHITRDDKIARTIVTQAVKEALATLV